jgi:hypothetical protein
MATAQAAVPSSPQSAPGRRSERKKAEQLPAACQDYFVNVHGKNQTSCFFLACNLFHFETAFP